MQEDLWLYLAEKLYDFIKSGGYDRYLAFMPDSATKYMCKGGYFGMLFPPHYIFSDNVIEFIDIGFGITRILVSKSVLDNLSAGDLNEISSVDNEILVEATSDIFNHFCIRDMNMVHTMLIVNKLGKEDTVFDLKNLFLNKVFIKMTVIEQIISSGRYIKDIECTLTICDNTMHELQRFLNKLYSVDELRLNTIKLLINTDTHIHNYTMLLMSMCMDFKIANEIFIEHKFWDSMQLELKNKEAKFNDICECFCNDDSVINYFKNLLNILDKGNIVLYLPGLFKNGGLRQKWMNRKCKGLVVF